jgi:hypothetical protein
MWLRDKDDSDRIAHLLVCFYGKKEQWPAFNISKDSGEELYP